MIGEITKAGESPAYVQAIPSDSLGSATVKMIGGKSVVWNQLSPIINYSFDVDIGAKSQFYDFSANTKIVENHKYYVGFTIINKETDSAIGIYVYTRINGESKVCLSLNQKYNGTARYIGTSLYSGISNGTAQQQDGNIWIYTVAVNVTGNKGDVSDVMIIDLTQMFGAGNEPTSVDDPRIAFIESYAAEHPEYNAGEIISAKVDKVVSSGENILDHSLWHQGVINIEGNIISQTPPSRNVYTDYISVDSKDYYFKQPNAGQTTYCHCYDNDKEYLGRTDLSYIQNNAFTVLSGTKYVRFMLYNGTESFNVTDLLPMSVVRGATAPTSVTPYRAPIEYPIPAAVQALPGYGWSTGDAYNYVDFERKKFVQNVGKLSSTDATSVYVYENFGYVKFTVDSGFLTFGNGQGICSYGTRYAYNYGGNNFFVGGARIVIFGKAFMNSIGVSTTEQWVNYIEEHPVDFYCKLATPIETDISAYITDDVFIDTEVGGAITFHQQNNINLEVPNTVEHTVGRWKQIAGTYKSLTNSRRAMLFGHAPALLYLFNSGDTCDDVTGGYVAKNYKSTSRSWVGNVGTPQLTLDQVAGKMRQTLQASGRTCGTIFTNSKIDVTNFSKIIIDFYWTLRNGAGSERNVGFAIGFADNMTNGYVGEFLSNNQIEANVQVFDGIVELDISQLSGEKYFITEWYRTWDSASYTNCYADFRKIWLE